MTSLLVFEKYVLNLYLVLVGFPLFYFSLCRDLILGYSEGIDSVLFSNSPKQYILFSCAMIEESLK